MSRFDTGNPLDSNDPRDLDDNAKNLDQAVNSEDSQWIDRFGRPRLPLMEQERRFIASQDSRDDQFQSAQSSRDDQFQSAQSSREAVFSNFLQASGYQDLGEYAPGIEITAHNQYVTFGGQPYLLKPSIPVPYTTSGAWTGDDFKLIGDDALRQDLANPDLGAAMVAVMEGGTAQDQFSGLRSTYGDWAAGGGRNLNANPDVNYIAPGVDSTINLGGRGWKDDPNRIPGSRERNSYVNYVGYWPVGQTEIGGTVYDDFVLATSLNPSANPELSANIGGGDNFVGNLASANIWSFHCRAGLYGNHSWNVGCTYSVVDGFYAGNLFGSNNQNYGNRSANIASYNCRIGSQGVSTAEQVVNSSLTRHSSNICCDSSSVDTSYTTNISARLSGGIRDFTVNHGFGVSGEIFNGISYGWAFNTRGDNQVTKVLLSRTSTSGLATTLSASGDWAFKESATTQEKNNANGSIVIGQNTMLGISANLMAMQRDGIGYYRSRMEILVRMDGAGTATLLSAKEYEVETNKQVFHEVGGELIPSSSWVWDVTVNSVSGVVALRFKGLNGETVICNADCSVQRLRNMAPAMAIVPPIPFETLS